MPNEKWEKFKKNIDNKYITVDEIVMFFIGCLVFIEFPLLKLAYIILIVLWYWLKIRNCEDKIIKKKVEIYNKYYEMIEPVAQSVIDGRYNQAKKPMSFDLEILEENRKFLVDKFAIINLIIIVLIQIFINK